MIRTRVIRVDDSLAILRKRDLANLQKALNGLKIHEVDIDKLYAKKLRSINILEEFFKQ
jgi:hypothetical protein